MMNMYRTTPDQGYIQNLENSLKLSKAKIEEAERRLIECDKELSRAKNIMEVISAAAFLALLVALGVGATAYVSDADERAYAARAVAARYKPIIKKKAEALGYDNFQTWCISHSGKDFSTCTLQVDGAAHRFVCREGICLYSSSWTLGDENSPAYHIKERNAYTDITWRLKYKETAYCPSYEVTRMGVNSHLFCNIGQTYP